MDDKTVTKHTLRDLRELQALPLYLKVSLTKQRIREWIRHYGEDGVYVSFSGGKDSTVLLHIVREEYPNVPAVFVDTGLEYPEIRSFVRTFENVEWVKPKMNFRQVIEQYGYPFISKEVAHKAHDCRVAESNGKESYARRQFNGTYTSKNGKTNMLSITKWSFVMDAPFKISHMCCDVMKKRPAKHYTSATGRTPMTAQMAEESYLRRAAWQRNGCNAFLAKRPISNPMSFWTEQDVLRYVRINQLKIAAAYGDIVEEGEVAGQMLLRDYIEAERPTLKTTQCDRTGCMFCGFGCHREKPEEGRFIRLKAMHPEIYNYIMKPWDEGGLGYKEVIDWLNQHGNLHIRY